MPVPFNGVGSGITVRSLSIRSIPRLIPAARGANVTLTTHVPPAGSGEDEMQLSVAAKSSVARTVVTRMGS